MTKENIFQIIGQLADKQKVKVYVVGGYVRDDLLGRPCTDLDFVVVGKKGTAFAKKAADAFGTTDFALFKEFDTAKIHFQNYVIEFVGARKEVYKSESRKPSVKSADLREDLLRRDFTINAMARGLNSDNYWQLYDYFHGVQDLENKIIKTTQHPKQVFEDDPLRMIRAIRLSGQLGFTIDPIIFTQIKESKERLEIISFERIRDEIFKILLSKMPSIGLWNLFNSKILDIILPELSVLYGIDEVEGIRHKNNLAHTFEVVDSLRNETDDLLILFSGLLHDIGKDRVKDFKKHTGWTFYGHDVVGARMAREVCYRFRLPKDWAKFICKMVRMHLQPISLADAEVTDSAIRRLIVKSGEDLESLLMLVRSDLTSKNIKRREEKVRKYDNLVKHILEVKEKDKLAAFQSPVRGDEIMKIANLKPGKEVGRLKNAIEEAILNGEIANEYEPALEFLHKLLEKKENG